MVQRGPGKVPSAPPPPPPPDPEVTEARVALSQALQAACKPSAGTASASMCPGPSTTPVGDEGHDLPPLGATLVNVVVPGRVPWCGLLVTVDSKPQAVVGEEHEASCCTVFFRGVLYTVPAGCVYKYPASHLTQLALTIATACKDVTPAVVATSTADTPVLLPYERHTTVVIGAGNDTVVDVEVMRVLEDRRAGAHTAVVRGVLLFNSVVRQLYDEFGAVPALIGVQFDALMRTCLAQSNPNSRGATTSFHPALRTAWQDAVDRLAKSFPLPCGDDNSMGAMRGSAGLNSTAHQLFAVTLRGLTAESLRAVVKGHLIQACCVPASDVDRLLDADKLRPSDVARFSNDAFRDPLDYTPIRILELYFLARDPESHVRARQKAGLVVDEVDAAAAAPGGAGADGDSRSTSALGARVAHAATLRYHIVRCGTRNKASRLPALCPIPATTLSPLIVTRDCVPSLLKEAARRLRCMAQAGRGDGVAPSAQLKSSAERRALALETLAGASSRLPLERLFNPSHATLKPLLARYGGNGWAGELRFVGAQFHIPTSNIVLHSLRNADVSKAAREVDFGPRNSRVFRSAPGSSAPSAGRWLSHDQAAFKAGQAGAYGLPAIPESFSLDGISYWAADPGSTPHTLPPPPPTHTRARKGTIDAFPLNHCAIASPLVPQA